MLPHQYACPQCGRTLQSAQDVAGRPVKCLGCAAVFTAAQFQSTNSPAPSPGMVIESAPPASAVLRNEPKLRTIMPGILMAPPDPLPSDLELLPLNGTPEQAPAPAVTAPPPVMKKVEPPPPPKPPAPAKLPPPMPRKRAEREQSYDPPPRRRRSEREDDYYDPPPAKSKVPVIPLVIGGAALVAVLVAVF